LDVARFGVELRVFVDAGRSDDNSAAAACEGGFCFFWAGGGKDCAGLQDIADQENRYGGYRDPL
jgi:hypothetical protein